MTGAKNAYEATGVDYDVLDAAKREAQQLARETTNNAARLGAVVNDASRGEPATIVKLGDTNLGFVLECLGTKSNIARTYEEEAGVDRFGAIGYDTVAAAVNDCICVGALPFVVNAYFATGAASFYDGKRNRSLVAGFARGCADSGAAWGGGESPTLAGLVFENSIDLAASAVGKVPDGVAPLVGDALTEGDAIIFIGSSGLHANGASLARSVANDLDEGFATKLPSGRAFGDAILDESIIYVRLIEAILNRKIPLHYASHITGHGLRKLMRADRDFTYRIDTLPKAPEVLTFLVEQTKMSPHDAYGTLNMGVGFALYAPVSAVHDIVAVANELDYEAHVAGRVEAGSKRVILETIGVTYEGSELELR